MITFRWTKYTLPNGREVFLTNRPDVIEDNSLNEWLECWNPVVRFCFTDDYVIPPANGPGWHWLPWVPGKAIPIENVYAYICMMDRYQKADPGPIWLHCDSSTMRAPTYFGLFLHAIYPEKVQDIIATRQTSKATQHHSCPISYSETSFVKDPGVKELIELWSKDGEKAAYKLYMKDDPLI